jgi:integrase
MILRGGDRTGRLCTSTTRFQSSAVKVAADANHALERAHRSCRAQDRGGRPSRFTARVRALLRGSGARASFYHQAQRGRPRTALGARDHALLLFLYNSGARADEAAKLTIGNLQLGRSSPSARILGKGNKIRMCPLWPTTTISLSRLVIGRGANEAVFLGRTNHPITRFGVHRLVTHYAKLAAKSIPSITGKRVSPHRIRHTTAVHLLRAGVDINTIRAWLGHVSLDTMHVYAEVDIEMKAKALASVDISDLHHRPQRGGALPSLMAFLKGLQGDRRPVMCRAGRGKERYPWPAPRGAT